MLRRKKRNNLGFLETVSPNLSTALLLALIAFGANSAFLTFYFSAIMLDSMSKRTIHIDALKIALPGTILLSIFIFLTPVIPRLMPLGPLSSSIDIGLSAAAVTWVVLTKRYCDTGWLGAIMVAAVGAIPCIFVVTFVDKFLGILLQEGLPPWV